MPASAVDGNLSPRDKSDSVIDLFLPVTESFGDYMEHCEKMKGILFFLK